MMHKVNLAVRYVLVTPFFVTMVACGLIINLLKIEGMEGIDAGVDIGFDDDDDPYKQIDYTERRTKGCFACHHSKREELDGKMRSFCRPIQDGIITLNRRGEPLEYPDESEDTCKWFVRK